MTLRNWLMFLSSFAPDFLELQLLEALIVTPQSLWRVLCVLVGTADPYFQISANSFVGFVCETEKT